MKKISADYVFPITSEPVKEGVMVLNEDNEILDLTSRAQHDPGSIDIREGVLVPGFVNTHCHLELSHMKNMVDTGTGLIPFIHSVVTMRDIPEEKILDAINKADREMYDNGIVAVGDISNKLDTVECKNCSKIRYYTFVEMFDFLQNDQAEVHYGNFIDAFKGQSDRGYNRKSCVPHAPYTVSSRLFEMIERTNMEENLTISIHNQETPHENNLFLKKTGDLLGFFEGFGFSLDHFQATGQTAIHYALKHMNPEHRTLFVHNTMSTAEDIQAAHQWSNKVYWATCANANLYIENRMPHYKTFLDNDARMTIGTDSLTSNWQLSVLEEMKTIARYQSYVPFETLLRWATLNGAEALGYDKDLGSFDKGKTPGVNLLNVGADWKLTADTEVRRLI